MLELIFEELPVLSRPCSVQETPKLIGSRPGKAKFHTQISLHFPSLTPLLLALLLAYREFTSLLSKNGVRLRPRLKVLR